MTDQISTLLLSAFISTIVSFLVAIYFGEMAATKYAQKETKRREHERILITNPLAQLQRAVYHIDNFLINRSQNIDIHQLRSPDVEFFHEHLKTGYPKLWKTILEYKNTYNSMANQADSIYQSASDLLEKKWEDDPNLKIEAYQLKSNIKRIIESFSGEVVRRVIYGNEPQLMSAHLRDPPQIIVGANNIMITSGIDLGKIVTDLKLILEGSEVFGELQQLWEKSRSLSIVQSDIYYELELMKSLVHSGVHLEGWCTVGIAANYEYAKS